MQNDLLHSASLLKGISMISAILLSGGQGSRMNSALPKQYLPLHDTPLILHSWKTLQTSSHIDEVIIVCDPSYQKLFSEIPSIKPFSFALPGAERQDSVYQGMLKASSESKFVCIHDGARPLLTLHDLDQVILAGKEHGAATLAVPVKMTIKESDEKGFVKKTLNRSALWEIQTPQVLSYSLLQEGFQKARQEKCLVTDDVSLAELLGHPVKLVLGSYSNIKITTPEDLAFANVLMRSLIA